MIIGQMVCWKLWLVCTCMMNFKIISVTKDYEILEGEQIDQGMSAFVETRIQL